MLQFKHIDQEFETPNDQLGVSVRLGTKWLERWTGYAKHGQPMPVALWNCAVPHEGDCSVLDHGCREEGEAHIISVYGCTLGGVPEGLLQLNSTPEARDLDALWDILEASYKTPLDGTEQVSVVVFLRVMGRG